MAAVRQQPKQIVIGVIGQANGAGGGGGGGGVIGVQIGEGELWEGGEGDLIQPQLLDGYHSKVMKGDIITLRVVVAGSIGLGSYPFARVRGIGDDQECDEDPEA